MRRFQSADAFRKALESVRARPAAATSQQQPVAAQAQQPPLPPRAKSNRGLWMAAGAMACVGVLIGGAVALPHLWKSSAATKTAEVVAAPPVEVPVTQSPVPQANPTSTSSTPPAAPKATTPSNFPHKVVYPMRPPDAKSSVKPPPLPAVTPPAGPSQEQIDEVSEELMKLRARADSVRGSLDHLRSQQAADGLSINPTIASGASRMDSYLQACERALQNNNLDFARKNLERADAEVTKLEGFFGR
jgi:hypothetical protein